MDNQTTPPLPRLYKLSSTGGMQIWDVWTEGNVIQVRHGREEGKVQATSTVIKEGKNLGKANATTPEQQAQLEAESLWRKQVERKGYVQDRAKAAAGETDQPGVISPMLAHKYAEHGDKMGFPIFIQPKLDGIRTVAWVKDGVCTLWSRERKPMVSLPHIVKAVEDWARGKGLTDCILDGEAYNHAYSNDFETITSFVKSKTPKEGHEVVQYHVYDYPSAAGGFAARTEEMRTFGFPDGGPLVLVATHCARTVQERDDMEAHYLGLGYEGIMARSPTGEYENRRSYSLQKIKRFQDAEFKIIGAEEGRGKDAGTIGAFVCVTDQGKDFNARLKASYARRRELFEGPKEAWLGKVLTVRFQGFTAEGKPRFCRGIEIRDYE